MLSVERFFPRAPLMAYVRLEGVLSLIHISEKLSINLTTLARERECSHTMQFLLLNNSQ